MPSESFLFTLTVVCAFLAGGGLAAGVGALMLARQRAASAADFNELVERAAAKAAASLARRQRPPVGDQTMDNITGAYEAGRRATGVGAVAAERAREAAVWQGGPPPGPAPQAPPWERPGRLYGVDEPGLIDGQTGR